MSTVAGRRTLLQLDSRQWWILLGGTFACLVLWGAVNILEDANASDDAYLRAQVYMERSLMLNHWNIPDLDKYVESNISVEGMHTSVHGTIQPPANGDKKVNPVALLQQFEQNNSWSDGMVGRLVRVPSAPTAHQPDDWEKAILSSSVASVKDIVNVQAVGTRPTLRVFRRLQTRQECLACHTKWVGKERETRSGISVAVPLGPFLKDRDRRVKWFGIIVLGLWASFAMGFTFLSQQHNRRREERDAAESERLKIESQFAEVWESSRDSMRLTDEEGITVAVNAAYSRLVEKDRAELIRASFSIIYPSGQREQNIEKYKIRFKTRTVEQFYEQEVTLWNGRRLWLEATTSFVKMADGSATLLTILRDISDRKQIEASLKERKQQFQEMFDDAPVGYHEFDAEGRLIRVNRTELAMLGYTREEMVGEYAWKFSRDPEASRRAVFGKLAGTVAPNRGADREYLRKDGTPLSAIVEDRVLRNASNGITGIRSTIQDATEAKRMQKAIEQSAESLGSIIEGIGIGIALSDHEGKFTTYNSALQRLTGYTLKEANALGDFSAVIFPRVDGRDHPLVGGLACGEDVTLEDVESDILTKDGKTKTIALSRTVLDQQNVRMLLSTWRDITARKRAEESLREQQQTFQAITRSANDGIVMMDNKDKVSFWNRAAENILGWSENEAMGQDVYELIVPARLRQILKGNFSRLQGTGGGGAVGKSVDLPARRKDNKEIEVALSLSAVALKGGWHSVGIFRDITELKRTELVRLVLYEIAHAATSLDSQEEFFEAIRSNLSKLIDVRNFYIAVVDASSDMVSFPYFVDEKDSPPDPQPLGTGLTDHVIRTGSSLFADAQTCEELEQRGLITLIGSPSALWLGVPLKTGDVVFGAIVVQSYTDPHCYSRKDLEILEYVASQLTHAINRKSAEKKIRAQVAIIEESNTALAHARDQALEANRAKGSFLATMSHELRTPLNAIIGYSEILLEEMGVAEKLAHAGDVGKIHEAGNHLLGLINDILDLSKIEAGRMELFVEEFSLTQLLSDVDATIQPLVARKANHLTVVGPEVPVTLHLDRTKVRQIVLNLLSNSCKFTENGEITLTVRADASHTSHPVDVIVFAIKDSGIGMTPEQTQRLFQEFSQADNSTTRKYGGTGLGLAISKRFCEMMHGSIDVQSVHHEGTEFTVTLPVSLRAPETPLEEEGPSHGEDGSTRLPQGPTVLIIDDDANVRELLTRMIRKDGFTVVTAENGADGVALARKLHPTVVILDAVMPHRDGWTVLREMKDDPELRSLPVIMHTIIDNKNLGFALGARDYLVKPVDHDTLIRALRQYKETDRSTRVLIVDDDARQRDKLSLMLSKEGCQTTAVQDGREALDSLSRSLPDVIILDLIMPTMDGFEFLNVLKDNTSWAGIPILILSAMDISRNEVKELSSSVVGVMQKGQYDPQQILALVRRYGRRT